MRRFLACAVAVVAATPAAGSAASTQPLSDVPANAIALVAGEPVPQTTFEQQMRRIRRSYELRRRTFPAAGSPAERKLRQGAVDLLVWRVVLRQAAAAFGVEVSEAEVEARVGQIREQWGGPASFRRVLNRLGLSETLLRDDIRTRMLLVAVRDQIWDGVTVTEEEIVAHYDAHLGDFFVPESRDVRHILLRTERDASQIRARLRAGASFAALARRHSLDRATRNGGGRLAVYRGRGDPRFERSAFALRVGLLSQPVRTRSGWHVIQALSTVRPAYALQLDQVRTGIRDLLLLTKANTLMDQWVRNAKAAWEPKVVYAPGFAPRTP